MKNLVPKKRTKIILHNILQCWIETISLNCHLIFNPITGKDSPLHHLVTLMNNFIRELPKLLLLGLLKLKWTTAGNLLPPIGVQYFVLIEIEPLIGCLDGCNWLIFLCLLGTGSPTKFTSNGQAQDYWCTLLPLVSVMRFTSTAFGPSPKTRKGT